MVAGFIVDGVRPSIGASPQDFLFILSPFGVGVFRQHGRVRDFQQSRYFSVLFVVFVLVAGTRPVSVHRQIGSGSSRASVGRESRSLVIGRLSIGVFGQIHLYLRVFGRRRFLSHQLPRREENHQELRS